MYSIPTAMAIHVYARSPLAVVPNTSSSVVATELSVGDADGVRVSPGCEGASDGPLVGEPVGSTPAGVGASVPVAIGDNVGNDVGLLDTKDVGEDVKELADGAEVNPLADGEDVNVPTVGEDVNGPPEGDEVGD